VQRTELRVDHLGAARERLRKPRIVTFYQAVNVYRLYLDAAPATVPRVSGKGAHPDNCSGNFLAQLKNFVPEVTEVRLRSLKPLQAPLKEFSGRVRRKRLQRESLPVPPVRELTKPADSPLHIIADRQINRRVAYPEQFLDDQFSSGVEDGRGRYGSRRVPLQGRGYSSSGCSKASSAMQQSSLPRLLRNEVPGAASDPLLRKTTRQIDRTGPASPLCPVVRDNARLSRAEAYNNLCRGPRFADTGWVSQHQDKREPKSSV
jgi:hypothetical protein